ncbi:uncharacterized protein LOC111088920 [Limulus polyphemus]|uniref:Uncharacterized protein LOC111088920 n=1 Tax=Limulus polyphemus TaxID=6850 RepID=A0ABM1TJA3_LIMPO|nr:uncharacterized protein LOC111088920 [Limulus polyphemus]
MDNSMFDDTEVGEGKVVLYLGIFGGVFLLLCLMCYCCNTKSHDDQLVARNGETTNRSNIQDENQQEAIISGVTLESGTPSPPPAYDTIMKKEKQFQYDQNPPPYEDTLLWQNYPTVHSLGIHTSSFLNTSQYQIYPTSVAPT